MNGGGSRGGVVRLLQQFVLGLVGLAIALQLLVGLLPSLVRLMRAAVPLIVAIGAVAVTVRIVWHLTGRD